jgi:hypothetical protein
MLGPAPGAEGTPEGDPALMPLGPEPCAPAVSPTIHASVAAAASGMVFLLNKKYLSLVHWVSGPKEQVIIVITIPQNKADSVIGTVNVKCRNSFEAASVWAHLRGRRVMSYVLLFTLGANSHDTHAHSYGSRD